MKKLTFKPYIKADLNGEILTISNPIYDKKTARVFEMNSTGLLVLSLIEKRTEYEEFKQHLAAVNCLTEGMEILEHLINLCYVDVKEETEEPFKFKKYNRIMPIWEMFNTNYDKYEIQNNFSTKKIGIIGCGTVGINMGIKLSALGFSNFILMDDDVVESTNLTRCTYLTHNDMGHAKVDVLKRNILDRIDPEWCKPIVYTYKKNLNSSDDLKLMKDIDVLIYAADDESKLNMVIEFSDNHNVPLVYPGGYMGFDAYIYPVYLKGQNLNPVKINELKQNLQANYGHNINKPSEAFIPSSLIQTADIISNVLTFELTAYFVEGWTDLLKRSSLVYNIVTNTMVEIDQYVAAK